AGNGLQQIFYFRSRKISIEYQPCLLMEGILQPIRFELLADGGAHTALPDDRIHHRSARRALPEDRGLTLIRDSQCGNLGCRNASPLKRFTRNSNLREPDGLGIVLHLPRARIDLLELLLRNRNNSALAPEHDRSAGGRALVEGQNVAFHALSIGQPLSFEALGSLIP